jgi:hypothetical protein
VDGENRKEIIEKRLFAISTALDVTYLGLKKDVLKINLFSKSTGHLDCARCDISRKGIRLGLGGNVTWGLWENGTW